jgi:hypothetical protein
MHLMFSNCLAFNKPGSYHHRYAQAMQEWWLPNLRTLMLQTLGMSRAHQRCTLPLPPLPSLCGQPLAEERL